VSSRGWSRASLPTPYGQLISNRKVFVAVTGQQIVGTAGLDNGWVRTVFVEPRFQGRGVGRLLMDAVERAARNVGLQTLNVPSSVTAEPFYARLGFKAVRDSYHGEERTIIMERSLAS
jgi:GNAT superfamily N-acetyltransferase